ncbi:hypothetical protein Afil01_22130 [Actinorhabdospora filicis]|uniref:DUF998 domain-containing protein n=1 Tax=Actinorhabdospora filicis TaxID=1785913 RepID=A0A9W6W9D3_9ACTN|nr:DUF998 domain-containing protein [Actinorhabdospora filicis]GLZ77406.1 hypothetical protein Afil01_22130 [Actinorhabdospora filicis]
MTELAAAPTAPVRRTALAGLLASLAAIVMIGAMDVWTLGADPAPWNRTISQYALWPKMQVVFLFGVALLAAGSLAVARAVVHRGLARWRSAPVIALILWSAGLFMVVVFEKHDWAVGPSWHGYLHNLGSLMAFIALPIAAIRLGRAWRGDAEWGAWASRTRAVGWLSYALFALVPVAIGIAAATGANWWEVLPLGLVERLFTLAEVVAVVMIGLWASSSRSRPAPVRA